MGLYRNTQTGDIYTAHGAHADWLLNQGEGLWVEVEINDPGELKGAELNKALDDAGLPKSGKVADKQARLAEYNAQQFAASTAPAGVEPTPPPADDEPVPDSSQAE